MALGIASALPPRLTIGENWLESVEHRICITAHRTQSRAWVRLPHTTTF
jgi:hypothetical protein